MKTTIEIADALLIEAKQVAAAEHTTLRELVESGLRKTLAERKCKPEPFKLEDGSFGHGGQGLQPPFSDDDWGAIRRFSYEDRGG